MKVVNRIGRKLNPKTRKEEIAQVEVDVETTPIRRPLLQHFVATDPMEIPTDLGLLEVAPGDHVVAGETGVLKVYTPEAFARAFVETDDGAKNGGDHQVDTFARERLQELAAKPDAEVLEGSLRNLTNVVTQQGIEIERLKSAVAARPSS